MTQIAVVQMCSGMCAEQNFAYVEAQIKQLNTSNPTLVCLPETWLSFNKQGQDSLEQAATNQQWITRLSQLCAEHKIWLAAGTFALSSAQTGKYHAASLLFNDKGELVARYNKIHLFDAQVNDGTAAYKESQFTQAGNEVVVVDSPFGRLGLSVCYDVRFAGLYQKMRELGAEVILIPSAFTTVTGEAHWQPLLQTRAIETQCYVIAAAQVGQHENGRQTHGHSMVLSPWGEVLADAGQALKTVSCEIDLAVLANIRSAMPVHHHNKFKSKFYE